MVIAEFTKATVAKKRAEEMYLNELKHYDEDTLVTSESRG